MRIEIDLKIEVVPKQRARKTTTKKPYLNKKGQLTSTLFYTPKKTRNFEIALKDDFWWYMKKHKLKPFVKGCMLAVTLKIWLKKKYGSAGDMDNYYKTIMDSGNKILYDDDKQIVKWRECDMFYGAETPRMILIIEELSIEEKQERGILI